MKRLALVVVVVAIGLCAAPFVRANSGTVEDAVEPGYAVDVESAKHHHPAFAPRQLIAHTLRATAEWDSPDMPRLRMKLRLLGAGKPTRRWITVNQEPRDQSFRGTVDDGERFLGFVYAWRPDRSSIRVEFPRVLVQGADAYRWSAKVYQGCPEEEGSSCTVEWDRVPDQGTILHEL